MTAGEHGGSIGLEGGERRNPTPSDRKRLCYAVLVFVASLAALHTTRFGSGEHEPQPSNLPQPLMALPLCRPAGPGGMGLKLAPGIELVQLCRPSVASASAK